MGAPEGAMWMVKFFDERFTVQNVGPGGLITFMWKISWKFSECKEWQPSSLNMKCTWSFLSVNLFENNLKFYLNKSYKTVYGHQLGRAIGNCTTLKMNVIQCEAKHMEKLDWQMSTTTEFYTIGNIQITHLPYKDDLTVKKYYKRLSTKAVDTRSQQEKRQVAWKFISVCNIFRLIIVRARVWIFHKKLT